MTDQRLEGKIDKLHRDADDVSDLDETRDALREAIELLCILRDERKDSRLAKAIFDFADWHYTGYSRNQKTKNAISRRLWLDVSEQVHRVLKATPTSPPFDEPDDGAGRSAVNHA